MRAGPVEVGAVAAIVFDMTGVITRSPLQAIEDYTVSAGARPATVLKHFQGEVFRQVLLGKTSMNSLVGDILDDAERTDGVTLSADRLRGAMRVGQQIAPDTAELIKELASYRLAVLTNNTTDLVGMGEDGSPDWWSDSGEQALAPRDFSLVMSSSKLGLVKPDIQIYRELLRRLALRADQVVYIDDQAANLEPAMQLGMNTIHFRDATRCRAALLSLGVRLAATAARPPSLAVVDSKSDPADPSTRGEP